MGGVTRRVPFTIQLPENNEPVSVEAMLSYALIPEPGQEIKDRFLATLTKKRDKKKAQKIIEDYASPRLLTFRIQAL